MLSDKLLQCGLVKITARLHRVRHNRVHWYTQARYRASHVQLEQLLLALSSSSILLSRARMPLPSACLPFAFAAVLLLLCAILGGFKNFILVLNLRQVVLLQNFLGKVEVVNSACAVSIVHQCRTAK